MSFIDPLMRDLDRLERLYSTLPNGCSPYSRFFDLAPFATKVVELKFTFSDHFLPEENKRPRNEELAFLEECFGQLCVGQHDIDLITYLKLHRDVNGQDGELWLTTEDQGLIGVITFDPNTSYGELVNTYCLMGAGWLVDLLPGTEIDRQKKGGFVPEPIN